MVKRNNSSKYQNIGMKLISYYSDSWKFIKSSKNFILVILLLFLFSGFLGVVFPSLFESLIIDYLKGLFSEVSGLGFWGLFLFILKNNFGSAFLGIFSGILLGVLPLVVTAVNGYVIGFVSVRAVETTGSGAVLLRLLPHGIFELPAIFISLAMGVRIGYTLLFIREGGAFKQVVKESFKTLIFIILPLLVLAALIESALIIFFG